MAQPENPQALRAQMVDSGRARFTVLTDRLIRMEWDAEGVFEDRATVSVINRRLPRVRYTVTDTAKKLVIKTDAVTVTYVKTGRGFTRSNLSATFKTGRTRATWHYGKKDKQNLGGTVTTLDRCDGDRVHQYLGKRGWVYRHALSLGEGLVSRSGWAVVDDTLSPVIDPTHPCGRPWATAPREGRRQDLYLFAYGHAYTDALADAAKVFGCQPLPPRYALGYWYSKYWAYTDREMAGLVDQYNRMDVPLDVLVVDMDWHLPGWTGYTWDKRFFPYPQRFLAGLHEQGLKTTLNLHPAEGVGRHEAAFEAVCKDVGKNPKTTPVVPFDCADPVYMDSYFKRLHHPLEKDGVDFWWMDWQQGEASEIPHLRPLTWLNIQHWHDQVGRKKTRPLSFSRYGGIGAGRYPVGFSGDTFSTWTSLAFQPHFTATAANVLYGYWSHDIGGHMPGEIDPELYLRWLQFGVFSPVLRTHASKNHKAERRFWEYPAPFSHLMVDAVRERYAMIPYIYTECQRTRETGVSLVRPMYYGWPESDAAYQARGQYMFGEQMLVAPVVQAASTTRLMAQHRVWLPPGDWFDTARGLRVKGNRWIEAEYLHEDIPVFVRPGAIIPKQGAVRRLNAKSYPTLELDCYAGGDGVYEMYEDDGLSPVSVGDLTQHVRVPMRFKETAKGCTVRLSKSKGTFKGFAARRPLTLRIHGIAPPKSLMLDGRSITAGERKRGAWWRYDGESAFVEIHCGTVNLTKGVRVSITEGDAVSRRQLNGWKGLMKRLGKAADLFREVLPLHALHPEERLIVELGQAANRLSVEPERIRTELRFVRRRLKDVPEILTAFHKALHASPDEDDKQCRGEMTEQAREIVRAATKHYS